MLTGLKRALALARLHPHPSVLSFLQGEGGEILQGDRDTQISKGNKDLVNHRQQLTSIHPFS